MSEYTPDAWVILKFSGGEIGEPFYRVLAGWYGGYLGADSWKLNSGITEIVEHENHYEVFGHSGSIYECGKSIERLTGLTGSILAKFRKQAEELANGVTIEVVTIEEMKKEFIK